MNLPAHKTQENSHMGTEVRVLMSQGWTKVIMHQGFFPVMVLGLIILGLVGDRALWWQPLNRGMTRLLEPIRVTQTQINHSLITGKEWLIFSRHGARRIQDLEARVADLTAQTSQLTQLSQENQAYRQLLDVKLPAGSNRVVANLLLSAEPIFGAGSDQGVKVGSLVFTANILVGRIIQVQPQQARIQELNHKLSAPILVKTESGFEGLLGGDGKRILITDIPINASVKEGEAVTTAGQPGIVAGLYIGRLHLQSTNPADAMLKAVIYQDVSLFQATSVEVRQ